MTNYCIVTAGRTGSTLLNHLLTQIGMGNIDAHLDEFNWNASTNLESIKEHIEDKRVNGICGVKLSWGNLYTLYENYVPGLQIKPFFDEILPDAKFIYLTRHDRVHQAVSRIKHIKTKNSHVWGYKRMQQYKDREGEVMSEETPFADIDDRIYTNTIEYEAWELFFKNYNITPLRIIFEDFIADIDGTLKQILVFLGQSVPKVLDYHIELKDTHSKLNDKWYHDIIKDFVRYF